MVVTESWNSGKLTSIINIILDRVCMKLEFDFPASSHFVPNVPLRGASPSVAYERNGHNYVSLGVQIAPGEVVRMPLHRARWIRDIAWEEYPRI